jgi:hypothetical protein
VSFAEPPGSCRQTVGCQELLPQWPKGPTLPHRASGALLALDTWCICPCSLTLLPLVTVGAGGQDPACFPPLMAVWTWQVVTSPWASVSSSDKCEAGGFPALLCAARHRVHSAKHHFILPSVLSVQ